jgi:hypothetical protein
MMVLRRYAVTVMDNWTPWRSFWTESAARRFQQRHVGYSYLFRWRDGEWLRWSDDKQSWRPEGPVNPVSISPSA